MRTPLAARLTMDEQVAAACDGLLARRRVVRERLVERRGRRARFRAAARAVLLVTRTCRCGVGRMRCDGGAPSARVDTSENGVRGIGRAGRAAERAGDLLLKLLFDLQTQKVLTLTPYDSEHA